MHILYVDESGDDGFPEDNIFSPENTPSNKFVRSGLIIHDWKWKKTNDIIADFKFSKRIPKDVELHATEIRRGKKKITDSKTKKRREVSNWYGQRFPDPDDRLNLLKDCCKLINTIVDITLIFIVIDKSLIDKTISGHNTQEVFGRMGDHFILPVIFNHFDNITAGKSHDPTKSVLYACLQRHSQFFPHIEGIHRRK